MKSRTVALFGGTFDPFHSGHLNLSLSAIQECALDELILMPNYISPFKQDQNVTSGEIRSQMVEAILHYHPALSISRHEVEREEPSYTYDTLHYFRNRMNEANLSFIIGGDSMLTIDSWYHGEDILREFPIIVGRRPNISDDEITKKIDDCRRDYDANITVLHLKPFDASSTEIRERIGSGIDIDGLVPPEIEEYIKTHGLYQNR